MAASLFDSPNYAKLFPVGDAGRLFTDSAEVRAMMLVEGCLLYTSPSPRDQRGSRMPSSA